MKSAIFMNGRKFDESEFSSEEDFEKVVTEHFKTLYSDFSDAFKYFVLSILNAESILG